MARMRTQMGFEVDPELMKRVQEVARSLKSKRISQADILRSAVHEKVAELEGKIERGEEIVVTL